jgi:eukaryotic-like serine/threonine-protein kinase
MSLDAESLQRIQQRVGTVVRGKYRLERLLGVGGMAAVFEATHRNGNRVALKMLHPEFARYGDVRTRFLREGYVANRVGHPGVTRVIDDDDDDEAGTVFLVLELLIGETLDARAERAGGRLPLVETVLHVDRLLDVLGAAHAQGIVHRDVKPDNVFLTAQGEIKVLDFGIARLLDGTGATRSGQLLGTPAYMSPEQANGRVREVDGRSDLWSVGAVVFTLLTGAPVHEAQTATEHLIYAATQPSRPIESIAPWLVPDVARVINCALAYDRNARWATAAAMQAALRATTTYAAALRGSGPPPPQVPPGASLTGTLDLRDRGPTTGTLVLGSPISAQEPAFDLVRRPGPGGGGERR